MADSQNSSVGIVVSGPDSPNTSYFPFLVKGDVRKNQFVCAKSQGGKLLGMVVEITSSNKYFEKAEGVGDFSQAGPIADTLPVGEWEFSIATVRALGVLYEGRIARPEVPLAPGAEVGLPSDAELGTFLGLDAQGLNLGNVANSGLVARIDVDRLLSKHMAILAMSGAGKSHLAAVLIEELLCRSAQQGRIATVVFDLHGEYTTFSRGDFAPQTTIVKGSQIRLPLKNVTASMIRSWYPEISHAAMRVLEPALQKTKEADDGIDELVKRCEENPARDSVKGSLVSCMHKILRMKLVSKEGLPKLKEVAAPSRLCVFDLSDVDSQKKRQIIVQYFAGRIFKFVKKGRLAPTVIMLEEAHNFAPEKARKGTACAKGTIEKIAREGRKFGCSLCLISQRPVHLSVTTLSQCNSNIILRIVNPNDLKNIETSCEGIDEHMLRSITTLRTGDAIVIGEAVNHPIFVKVRQRKTHIGKGGGILTQLAKKFEEKKKKDAQSVEAYI